MPLPPTPASDTAFATNSNYATGVDAGSPVRVPPLVVDRADGFRRAERPPAQEMNAILGAFSDWLQWAGQAVAYLNDVLTGRDTPPDPTFPGPWVPRELHLHGSALRPWKAGAIDLPVLAVVGGGFRVAVTGSNQLLAMPLNRYVPAGARVESIDLLVTPGVHTSTATEPGPGQFTLGTVSHIYGSGSDVPVLGTHLAAQVAETSGSGPQRLTLGSPFIVASDAQYYLAYNPRGLTSRADVIHGLRIQYLDPGPRNF